MSGFLQLHLEMKVGECFCFCFLIIAFVSIRPKITVSQFHHRSVCVWDSGSGIGSQSVSSSYFCIHFFEKRKIKGYLYENLADRDLSGWLMMCLIILCLNFFLIFLSLSKSSLLFWMFFLVFNRRWQKERISSHSSVTTELEWLRYVSAHFIYSDVCPSVREIFDFQLIWSILGWLCWRWCSKGRVP